MISLLLHKSKAKRRTSVNNKDIIQMYLGYNLKGQQLIIASFYKEHINTRAFIVCVTFFVQLLA